MAATSLIFDLLGRDVSASKTLKKVAAEAETQSSSMSAAFKKAATGVTIAGAAAVAEGVHMATDFQSKMTLLETAGGELHKNMATVSSGILQLARDTGTSTDDLAEGMYTAEKAGQHGAAGLKELRAAAEGAKAENVDLGTAMNALTSVMMSYHYSASQATSVENMLVEGAGKAKTTMQNYAGALSTVIPVASAAGVGFDQVAGAVATLTQHGTSADEATQELANTIRNLQAPNAVASKAMQQLGLDVNDVSKNLGRTGPGGGLTGTIEMITSAITNKLGPAGLVVEDTFKKSQSASADMQAMLGKMPPELARLSKSFADGTTSYKDYNKAVKGMGGTAYAQGKQFMALQKSTQGFNDLIKSGNPAAQTFAATLKQVMGGATGMNTALMLGGDNMAYFKKATDDVAAAGKKSGKDISTWAQTQKNLSVQVARGAEDVKTLGIEVGTKLIPPLTSLLGFLMRNKSTVGMLAVGLLALAVSVKTVQGVIKLAKVAQAAWTAATRIAIGVQEGYKVAMGVSTAMTEAQAAATEQGTVGFVAMKVAQVATTVASKAMAAAQWLVNAAMDANPIMLVVVALAALVGAFVLAYNKLGWFRDFVKASFSAIKDAVSACINWIKKNWPLLLAILSGPIGLAVLAIVKNWHKITAGISAVVSWIRQHWPLLLEILTGPIGVAVVQIVKHWHSIENGAKSAMHGVEHAFTTVVSFIRGVPGKLAKAGAGMFSFIADGFRAAIDVVINGWNSLHFTMPSVNTHIPGVGKIGGWTIGLPHINPLAEGGTVKARPGGTLALLAEAGRDETVVDTGLMNAVLAKMQSRLDEQPEMTTALFGALAKALDNRPAGHGGTTTVIVELDGRQIARAMGPALADEIRVRTGVRR